MSGSPVPELRVSEIWRFPVKSIGGEQLMSAAVDELGIEGDRRWGIADLASGTILTARRAPDLLFASAALDGDGVAITLCDGAVLSSRDPDIDAALSDWLDRDVELRRAGDVGGTYEVPLDFENDENWVSWQGPAQAWHDSTRSRLSLVSRTTLGSWAPARFRTNVILDGHGEDDLVDRVLTIGSVTIDVRKRIDRCVIVTRPQPGIERDIDLLKSINADRDSCLAVGALVTEGGTIAVGDHLSAT